MKDDEIRDRLEVDGILAMGYGNSPKILHKDRRLTMEAKEIYCYLSSYCGGGSVAFPSRKTILYDLVTSETRFYRHFQLLKDYGYIEVTRIRKNNKFGHNVYKLIQNPSLCPRFEGIENECIQKQCIENEGTNKNSTNKNKKNKNNNNITDQISNTDTSQSSNVVVVKDFLFEDSSMIPHRSVDNSSGVESVDIQAIDDLIKKYITPKQDIDHASLKSISAASGFSMERLEKILKTVQGQENKIRGIVGWLIKAISNPAFDLSKVEIEEKKYEPVKKEKKGLDRWQN
ncbi:MAG: helix-turn-helix domain-containing protein [Firmicutes bacterium]|nr:helix-turn-helix domain-containing protein [Bacillota bacterium]